MNADRHQTRPPWNYGLSQMRNIVRQVSELSALAAPEEVGG